MKYIAIVLLPLLLVSCAAPPNHIDGLKMDGVWYGEMLDDDDFSASIKLVFDEPYFVAVVDDWRYWGTYETPDSHSLIFHFEFTEKAGVPISSDTLDFSFQLSDAGQSPLEQSTWYIHASSETTDNFPPTSDHIINTMVIYDSPFASGKEWPIPKPHGPDEVMLCNIEEEGSLIIPVESWGMFVTDPIVWYVEEVIFENGAWDSKNIPWLSFPPDVYEIEFTGNMTLFPHVNFSQVTFDQPSGLRIVTEDFSEIIPFVADTSGCVSPSN